MKTYYLLLLFALPFIISCKHENPNPDPVSNNNKDLLGEWIWVLKSGGIAGISKTPDDGFNIHYLFNDSKLKITENAKDYPAMRYSVTEKKSLLSNQLTNFLILNSADCPTCQLMQEYTFQISKAKDTLQLNEDVYDGFNYTFVRKRTDGWLAATYVGIDPRLCPSPCCGGYLFNIEGVTYTTTTFPSDFKMDFSKKPQKLLVKIGPTPFSCTPIPIIITEAKLLP
jgi:hypothetical protein